MVAENHEDQITRCAGEPYPLHDLDGGEVLLKENVIFSSKVN